MAVRILLVDDHEIVLEGIRGLVASSGRGWEICGEARNGKEAIEMIKSLKPDVAVLDITMPVMSGLDATREIARLQPDCRILMFTMHESLRLGVEARAAGTQGYVVKSQAARDLIRAIDYVLAGKTFFGAPPETGKSDNEPEKQERTPNALFRRTLAFVLALTRTSDPFSERCKL
jgi:DNA-binding NarL/FixJ family response regulator